MKSPIAEPAGGAHDASCRTTPTPFTKSFLEILRSLGRNWAGVAATAGGADVGGIAGAARAALCPAVSHAHAVWCGGWPRRAAARSEGRACTDKTDGRDGMDFMDKLVARCPSGPCSPFCPCRFPGLGKICRIFSEPWKILREIFQCLEKQAGWVSNLWKDFAPRRKGRNSKCLTRSVMVWSAALPPIINRNS